MSGRPRIKSEIHQLSEGEAMYVAACLDTDGFIGINPNRQYFEAKVAISNNNTEFLEHVQRMVGGGHIGNHRCIEKLRPTHNPQFNLTFRVAEMLDLLPQVLPFLIIKRGRAIEVLDLLGRRTYALQN